MLVYSVYSGVFLIHEALWVKASDTHALLTMSTDGMPLAQLVGNTTTWSYTSDVALVNASVHMSLPEAMTWHTLLLGADVTRFII